MKIRMTEQVTGTIDGRRWPAKGDEIEVPDAVGAHECANGRAEPVKEEKRETPAPVKRETRKKAGA